MRRLNADLHIQFLRLRLMAYLPETSLASRLKKAIAAEISYIFAGDRPYEVPYAALFPVRALFEWIMKHGGLSIEDLEDATGQLFGDDRKLIPDNLKGPISGAQQMAALGLWYIDSELNIAGLFNDDDYDEHGLSPYGWSEVDAINHKAECLLNAYQALCYAERLNQVVELSTEEQASVEKFDFSALGRSGAVVRQGPMNALREYALSLYDPQEWKSASQAAHALHGKIMDHGRTINADLRPSNAQRTVTEWFRKKTSSR
jgi:hypothetical protein